MDKTQPVWKHDCRELCSVWSVDCSPTFVRNGTCWQVVYNAACKESSDMIAENIPTTSHQYGRLCGGVQWVRPRWTALALTRQSTNMDLPDPPLSLMWSTSLDSAKVDSTSKLRCKRICPRMNVLTNFASRVDCDWAGWDSAWIHLCSHSPSKK